MVVVFDERISLGNDGVPVAQDRYGNIRIIRIQAGRIGHRPVDQHTVIIYCNPNER
jgi:hypothetical protein